MAGLFWRAVDYIKEQKRKREYEENKTPINIALERARINFDQNEYLTYDLEKIKEGIKKGLDVRYCLLVPIDYDTKKKRMSSSILEILEFEKEEGLLPGSILNYYYNGYYINPPYDYVQRIKEERKRQQVSNDINGFFRQR